MKKLGTFFLFLIMVALLGGTIFFAWMIFSDLFDADVIETLRTSDSMVSVDDGTATETKKEKKSIGSAIADIFTTTDEKPTTYSSQGSEGKFFYEQLNQNQKILYNALQESKEKMMSGNYQIQFGNKFYDILSKDGGSKQLGDDYQTAIEAFTHDNPDLFYVDVSKMYLNMEKKKRAFSTTYNVFIGPEDGRTYFAKGFTSEAQVKTALQQIQQVRDVVKSKLKGNEYQNIKKIHDYLVDNVEYDDTYSGVGLYSIYGALVKKKCVCEGYTRAFKYLADSAGIRCVLLQGEATNSDGTVEKHAWNAVYLNNNWYLIDTTWDDPIIIGRGFLLPGTHYKYFMKGSKTFAKDHTLQTQFSDGGKVFKYPNISEKDY